MSFNYAVEIAKGGRLTLEDAYCLRETPHWLLAGVFDGHGGNVAAQYAARVLPNKFKEKIKSQEPTRIFPEIFKEISGEIEEQSVSGTTALAILLAADKRLIWANVGDSRGVIIKTNGSFLQLTSDHRVNNQAERKRIIERGIGKIFGPYVMVGGLSLMLTRTLGDKYFKKAGVISEPEVGNYQIRKDDAFLILASDGVWDVLDNEQVAAIICGENQPRVIAGKIKAAVFSNGGTDNLTVIVVAVKD